MRGASRALVSVVVLVGCVAASAEAIDVEVGLGGMHRTGAWTPVVVALPGSQSAAGPWHVWVEDPDGQWVRSPAAVGTTGDGGARLRFRARFGRPAGGVQVEGPTDGGAPRTHEEAARALRTSASRAAAAWYAAMSARRA